MIYRILFLVYIILSFNACDILRISPFEVVSWTPGEGYHDNPDEITVSLEFSLDPDQDSVEKRFSFTGDNGRVKGNFSWEGRKVTFTPLTPLEKNTDYKISVSPEARDIRGLSMDTAFDSSFSTRPAAIRPVLVSFYPAMYAEVPEPRTEVRLEFSESVPLNTLYDNVSFTPAMTGYWRLENEGKLAVFTPAEPWAHNKRYEVRLTSSLSDNNGMSTGDNFTSVFTAGAASGAPVLLEARRVLRNGSYVKLNHDEKGYVYAAGSLTENKGWEKDDKLFLVFSKPADMLSVKNNLSVENAPSVIMEASPAGNTEIFSKEVVFSFNSIPAYESRFTFRLKPGIRDKEGNESENEYIFRIFADGKSSKPPSLTGIRMPMAPGSGTNPELIYFGIDSLFEIIPLKDGVENYPPGEGVYTWIELYFSAAEGASVNIFSLMELLRIETSNNVIGFSPRQVKTSGFSVPLPHTSLGYSERIEIAGILTNSNNYGLISFQIAPGLTDSLGNRNGKTLSISLIK